MIIFSIYVLYEQAWYESLIMYFMTEKNEGDMMQLCVVQLTLCKKQNERTLRLKEIS